LQERIQTFGQARAQLQSETERQVDGYVEKIQTIAARQPVANRKYILTGLIDMVESLRPEYRAAQYKKIGETIQTQDVLIRIPLNHQLYKSSLQSAWDMHGRQDRPLPGPVYGQADPEIFPYITHPTPNEHHNVQPAFVSEYLLLCDPLSRRSVPNAATPLNSVKLWEPSDPRQMHQYINDYMLKTIEEKQLAAPSHPADDREAFLGEIMRNIKFLHPKQRHKQFEHLAETINVQPSEIRKRLNHTLYKTCLLDVWCRYLQENHIHIGKVFGEADPDILAKTALEGPAPKRNLEKAYVAAYLRYALNTAKS
jgi:hypothetical protein